MHTDIVFLAALDSGSDKNAVMIYSNEQNIFFRKFCFNEQNGFLEICTHKTLWDIPTDKII